MPFSEPVSKHKHYLKHELQTGLKPLAVVITLLCHVLANISRFSPRIRSAKNIFLLKAQAFPVNKIMAREAEHENGCLTSIQFSSEAKGYHPLSSYSKQTKCHKGLPSFSSGRR